MRIYNQHYFILAQNLLNTRSQRFNYSWNTIKMKITRRQSKKTTHPLLKNTHVYSTFNPVYIKRNLSCAKKSIQLLEEVNHLHRYPEFIQPKKWWVDEGSWWEKSTIQIFAWLWIVKDRAASTSLYSSISSTKVDLREKISHHL